MPDLMSIIFPLDVAASTSFPVDGGRILQGAFLHWLKSHQPDVASRLHESNHMRPYTLSPLLGASACKKRRFYLKPDDEVCFRLTGFDATFNQQILEAARSIGHSPQPRDPHLRPVEIIMAPAAHPLAAAVNTQDLLGHLAAALQHKALRPDVCLQFVTPTCFMDDGASIPLPIPRMVFAGLANRWLMSAQTPLPVHEGDAFLDAIHIASAKISTRPVDFGKYRRAGFIGSVRFALPVKAPMLYRLTLHLLARLAFFTGVGSYTPVGMGQVRDG